MEGADWAYNNLVLVALKFGKKHVRILAKQYRKDVLDDCLVRAWVDIDWYPNSNKMRAFKTVRNVCMELINKGDN